MGSCSSKTTVVSDEMKIPQRAPNTTVAVPAPKAVAVTPNTTSPASKAVEVATLVIELKLDYDRIFFDNNPKNYLKDLILAQIEREVQRLESYAIENGIQDLVLRQLKKVWG